MTEQNFTKDDAKKAFNTLAKFGLQEGNKLANKAGAKLDGWKQKFTRTKETNGERCDHWSALNVPLSDPLVVGKYLKEAVDNNEVAKFLKHTYKSFDNEVAKFLQHTYKNSDVGYSIGMLVGSSEPEVLYSNFVTLGDLQIRLVLVAGTFARVTLLETNSDDLKAAGLGRLLLTNATVNAIVAVLPADEKFNYKKKDDDALADVKINHYW